MLFSFCRVAGGMLVSHGAGGFWPHNMLPRPIIDVASLESGNVNEKYEASHIRWIWELGNWAT